MKRIYLMAAALVLPTLAVAATTDNLDLDTPYVCTVMSSNNKQIGTGWTTSAFAFRSILGTGVIRVRSPNSGDFRSLDLYGTLKVYDLQAAGSGLIALATPPEQPREVHGLIVVNNKTESLVQVSVSIFQTLRAFRKSDESQAFLFAGRPELYELECMGK